MPYPDPTSVFRWLLRLYPRAYRARFGAEMEEFFRRERADSGGGFRFWIRLVLDHVGASRRVRGRAGGDRRMGTIRDDFLAAARTLRRAPAFTLFAAATLGLGIGATTAVYTVVDRVVLRPLPYEGADRLARVGPSFRSSPDVIGIASPALLVALADAPGPAELVTGSAGRSRILGGDGDPERIDVRQVDRGFFEMFGGRPALGRLLTDADHEAGAASVAVLTHDAWVRRFGQDPTVLERPLVLDDEPFTVVGVVDSRFAAPEGFDSAGDVFVSLAMRDGEPGRSTFFITAFVRLQPGASLADMDAHVKGLVGDVYPPGDGPSFLAGGGAEDLRAAVVGPVGKTLGRVLGAVLLLLLISCVNVASLLLTRGAERARELSVRAALGAGRGRLVRQLLAESWLLALAGAVLGAGLAHGALTLFRTYAPGGIPRLAEVGLDGRVLGATLAVTLGTVLVFGLVPALRATGSATSGDGAGRRTTQGVREGRLRGFLVAGETALAVVLVVASGLLAHDLVRVSTEDPGFRADGLVSMYLSLQGRIPNSDREAQRIFWRRALEEARTIPGVRAVSLTTQVPYMADDRLVQIMTPEGYEGDDGAWIPTVLVAGNFFETLGMRIEEGRAFDASEMAGARQVAMVNQAFVREHWPGGEGAGRSIKSGAPDVDDEGSYEVVGVVADIRARPGEEAGPTMYVPLEHEVWHAADVLVRTDSDVTATAAALRDVARRLDPGLPVDRLTTVEALGHEALTRPRFYTLLFGGFALVALMLSVVGVYGTTAYAARSRTREIGIRLALGALRHTVVAGVVGRTSATVVAGVAAGLALAAMASGGLSDILLRVEPRDALTYGVVAVVVTAAGVSAAWLPAHRAGRVDPAATLREQV
jgi:predicted permease